jgi:bleomycin hydrolase
MKHLLCFALSAIPFLLFAQSENQLYQLSIHLTDSVTCTEVKDQSHSPTCWVFGTNSLFESDLIKRYNIKVNLSEMFLARYAYIDKLGKYLATKGKTYYEGGGQFRDVLRVVNKYGMVPEEAYSGLTNRNAYHDHTKLDTAMQRLGRKFLKQGKNSLNEIDLKMINDTLNKYLGKVPSTFWYQMEQFTPATFAKKFVHFENDYVDVMSFANLPFYKRTLLDDKFNWADDSLFNVKLDDMETIIDTAIANGWSVAWEGDVTEPGFQTFKGYTLLYDSNHNYDEQRLQDFKTQATERDHMLHIVGIARDEFGKKWYHLKNSWGRWVNDFKGFLYMSEEYFKLKTVVVMVNKSALPAYLKEKLDVK